MNDHSHSHGHYHHHDEASGERFIPELMGGEILEAEHQARYRFALSHVAGKRVLDAGCGVGWGSKLLRQAGAREVVGLDISEEALADARNRAPECEFVQGDLQQLSFPDGSFDVVVCFEALEHAEDVEATLDGLARVLGPDGILFVSSPNPAVYPAGNPFHPSELPPEQLVAAVSARLPELRLFRQHELAVSLVAPDDLPGASTGFAVRMLSLDGLAVGHDPYSVVAASRVALPELAAWACAAPPRELKRLAAERVSMVEQLEDARAQLRDADTALRSLMTERDRVVERATELATQSEALRAQLDNQRRAADNAARERDDLAMRLISADRPAVAVPTSSTDGEDATEEVERLRRQLRRARRRIRELEGVQEGVQEDGSGARLLARLKRVDPRR